jgi:adenylate cyclase class 2
MHELEVKFYVPDLPAFERRLDGVGARLVEPRVHEYNLRFDTSAGELSRAYRALRLRQDRTAHLAYKGPSVDLEGARLREEIEVEVDDFAAARRFLEALGYQVWVIYEKYRTLYALGASGDQAAGSHVPGAKGQVLIALDELPYGFFVELEGGTGQALRAAADLLGLDWKAQIKVSYLELFQVLRKRRDLPFRDLIFENFQGDRITPEVLGVQAAWL